TPSMYFSRSLAACICRSTALSSSHANDFRCTPTWQITELLTAGITISLMPWSFARFSHSQYACCAVTMSRAGHPESVGKPSVPCVPDPPPNLLMMSAPPLTPWLSIRQHALPGTPVPGGHFGEQFPLSQYVVVGREVTGISAGPR